MYPLHPGIAFVIATLKPASGISGNTGCSKSKSTNVPCEYPHCVLSKRMIVITVMFRLIFIFIALFYNEWVTHHWKVWSMARIPCTNRKVFTTRPKPKVNWSDAYTAQLRLISVADSTHRYVGIVCPTKGAAR